MNNPYKPAGGKPGLALAQHIYPLHEDFLVSPEMAKSAALTIAELSPAEAVRELLDVLGLTELLKPVT